MNNSVQKKVEAGSGNQINGNENKNLQNNTQTIKDGLKKTSDVKSVGQTNNPSNNSDSKQIQTLKPKESEKKNCSTCPHENQKLDCRDTWDKVTNERIKKLDPRIRCHAKNFINRVEIELGYKFRISDGYRDFKHQAGLTTAIKAPPGKSYHNYGLAIDIVQITNNGKSTSYKLLENPNNKIAKIGKEIGFEWGGHWKTRDLPHFEMRFGKHWSEYLREYKKRGNKLGYKFEE